MRRIDERDTSEDFADLAGIASIGTADTSPQPIGHFFATHLDSLAGWGLPALVHSLVQRPSTGGVENLPCIAHRQGLACGCGLCKAAPTPWRHLPTPPAHALPVTPAAGDDTAIVTT
ncbi:hypothetical protein LL965_02390 [Xanthomonas cassavae CFBP 4642]|uniref:Uncharacterized protein n=1 Tax=Xanthomonas cassavae CFBP 4642 TaxID=1219375 RepID=A0ABS8H9Z3_9XANT|nr:hypothetical protein [Xanthomonas cassavae]MCC4618980.1 hypothetical protein [Xanthomonas cassavae CFBP 4642]